MQHPRLKGEEFWAAVDEFMRAVRHRWPHAVVQFEDFSSDHAADVLNAYRLKQVCFNDDIQGTGAVVLSGALSACKIAKIPLREQRIVVLGAGSAGLGVATTLLQGMMQEGLSSSEAQKQFFVFDQKGLIGDRNSNLTPGQKFFSRKDLKDQMDLVQVMEEVKPTMILGLSACRGAFTEQAIRTMAKNTPRPIVFPLSNPTSVAECSAEQAIQWTNGSCIFASGSPFDPVMFQGKQQMISQCNNMFIFPGVGLAAILCKASRITDRMLYSAARALSDCMTPEELERGEVFPNVGRIRQVSTRVATAVMQTALDDNIATFRPIIRRGSKLEDYVKSRMFTPAYRTLVP